MDLWFAVQASPGEANKDLSQPDDTREPRPSAAASRTKQYVDVSRWFEGTFEGPQKRSITSFLLFLVLSCCALAFCCLCCRVTTVSDSFFPIMFACVFRHRNMSVSRRVASYTIDTCPLSTLSTR